MKKRLMLFVFLCVFIFGIIYNFSFVDAWSKFEGGGPWKLDSFTYDGNNFLDTQDSNPVDLFFSPSGTTMFEMGSDGDSIYQYTCLQSLNISSCSYDDISIPTQDSFPGGIFFNSSGTRMFEVGTNGNKIYQYTCSDPWNLSSCSYDNINISTQSTYPESLFFNSSGTRMFEIGRFDGNKIYQYTCSDPWNLSSCSYDNINISTQDTNSYGLFFNSSGTRMFESGNTDKIYQYTCSDPWNLSSCSYDSFYIDSHGSSPSDLFIDSTGTIMFEVGLALDRIYQHSLSVPWNITSATIDDPGALPTQSINDARDLFFKADGTKLYESSGSRIFEYNCLEAWNISSCSYGNVNITTEYGSTQGIFFKTDGTKLYQISFGSDMTYQSNCSDPWNLSSCIYENVNISSQDATPSDIFFNSSGTRLYEVSYNGGSDRIYEYQCSDPWNLSSCLYDSLIVPQDGLPTDIFFKPDGTKLYELGLSTAGVYEYGCSTAWDLSTCSYNSASAQFNIGALDGFFFKPDGMRLYFISRAENMIYQYSNFIGLDYSIYNCTSCSDCTAAISAASAGDTVYLNNSIYDSNDASCIDFNYKDNIIFDCQGYTIDGNYSNGGYGIYLGPTTSNFNTIRNCNVQEFSTGLYNRQSSSNNIINSNFTNNSGNGIYFIYLANSNTIENVSVRNNGNGIYLYDVNLNNIRNSNFSGNIAYDFKTEMDADYMNNNVDSSNVIDYDKYIYYNYSISNYVFDSTSAPDAGIIVCYNCNNVTYRDYIIDNRQWYSLIFMGTNNSVVDNVTIIGREDNSNGAFVRNSDYNNFTDLNITNNSYGLYFYNSENSIVANSTFNYNSRGMHSAGTNHYNNTFVNIDASYNSYAGISTSNNILFVIENVTANYNNNYGIQLVGSQTNLTNNNMSGNKYDFANPAGSSNNIDLTNTINFDKRIYYNSSVQNYTFVPANTPDAGQFFCINCLNVTYRDFNIGSVYDAFHFNFGDNIFIDNVTINDTYNGVYFYGGGIDNSIIKNSRFYNQEGYAVNSYGGSTNFTIKNITSYNASTGLYIDGDSHLITNVTVTNPRNYGFFVSGDNHLINNVTVFNSTNYGIGLTATNSVVNDSVFSNSYRGIIADSATGSIVYNNVFNNTDNILGTPTALFYVSKRLGTNIISGSYIGGNYWVNPNGTGESIGCIDDNSDGLCDYGFFEGGSVSGYYALTNSGISDPGCNSCSGCNSKISTAGSSTIVKMNSSILDIMGNCIVLADNVDFDCQGYIIDGDSVFFDGEDGIYISSDNSTISNCIVKDFENGVRVIGGYNNNFTNITSRNNQESNFFIGDSDYNIFDNVTSIESNLSSSTYYISQLMVDESWSDMYSRHFPIDYSVEEFLFEDFDNEIKLRIEQRDVEFADIEQIRLVSCGEEIYPDYIVRLKSGESVLEDAIYDDNNVFVVGDDVIEASWKIPEYCNELSVLYLKANEYGSGLPFREPEYQDYFDYDLVDNQLSIVADGVINESDGVNTPDFEFFWSPATGHPDGYVYTYVYEDDENLYFAIDLTIDNTDEFGKDWVSVLFDTAEGEKKFLVNDSDDTYGKCSFGLTSKVSYKHQMCEIAVPKSEIGYSDYDFAIEYYGTAAPITYQMGNGFYFVDDSEYNIIKNSNISLNPNHGFYFQGHYGYPRYNIIYNNIVSNTNNIDFSTTIENYFNTTNTTGTNIVNGSFIGGNYWGLPNGTGFSDNCTDSNEDGFCDTNYTIDSSNIDYLPLVDLRVCTPSWSPSAWSTCTDGTQSRTWTDAYACDAGNTTYQETQSCTVDDGGSSGGGGGGTTTSPTEEDDGATEVVNGTADTSFDTMNPNETSTIEINDSDFGLTQISMNVSEEISGASISITEVDNRDDASLMLGVGENFATFEAFNVEKNGISNDNISEVTLNFRVTKEWAQEKFGGMAGFAKYFVRMYKRETVNDTWEQVDTQFLSEDDTYYYYEATSDGFSIFVIGLDTSILRCEVGEERCVEGSIRKCVEYGNETSWDLLKVCDNGCKDANSCAGFKFDVTYLIFGGLVLVFAGLIIVIVKFSRDKPKVRGSSEKKVSEAKKAVSKYVDKGKDKGKKE